MLPSRPRGECHYIKVFNHRYIQINTDGIFFICRQLFLCLPFMLESKLCFFPVPEGRLMGSQLQNWRFRSVGTFGVLNINLSTDTAI